MSTEFQTAREYFNHDSHTEPDPDAPAHAKSIVWFDQLTPIFVCCDCVEEVRKLRWKGDGQADNYDNLRGRAYEKLFDGDPRCDVCAGYLPELVGDRDA